MPRLNILLLSQSGWIVKAIKPSVLEIVPTFNSCTKGAAAGHKTRPHARLSPSFLDMDVWITSEMNVGY